MPLCATWPLARPPHNPCRGPSRTTLGPLAWPETRLDRCLPAMPGGQRTGLPGRIDMGQNLLVSKRSCVGVVAIVVGLVSAGCGGGQHPLGSSTTTQAASTATSEASSTSTTVPVSALPTAPNCDPQLGGTGFEPTSIFVGCATSADKLADIRWTTWNASEAEGTGTHSVNNCQPDCAGGTYSSFPVKVALSKPADLGIRGHVFTTITMTPSTGVGTEESAVDTPCPSGAAGPCAQSGADWGFVPNS